MKFSVLVFALALVAVACNKKEESAIQVVPVQGEVPVMNAQEGHDKDHNHVTEAPDHAHDDAHHSAQAEDGADAHAGH
jgi:hypothetical protein